MKRGLIIASLALPLLSGGCIAKTALDIVTLPVKAGAQVVDWTTTSQEESDRNYGRKIREQEAREGKAAKKDKKRDRQRPDSDLVYGGR